MYKCPKAFSLMVITNEPCVALLMCNLDGLPVQTTLYKLTTTNMAGVQNFKVTAIKFNVDGIFACVISRLQYKNNSNNDDDMLVEIEVCAVGKQAL